MIPIHKPYMPINIQNGLSQVLHSGQLSYGQYSKIFEKKIQNFVGNELTITVSGNSVLFALQLLDIKQGDEVIASPMSCLMTTQPVAICNATIVWADIDPTTGTLDPEDVQRKITSKTKAIIHYHWGGYPGYIDEINNIGRDNGITIIEEAGMAFGSEYKNNRIGNTKTDIVCFSFGPVRLPNTIEGAGISFNDSTLFNKALLFRDLGINRTDFRDELGEISIHSDVQNRGGAITLNNVFGFLGIEQMESLENLLNKQYKNGLLWRKMLINEKGISLLDERPEIKPNYWVYSVVYDNHRDKKLAMYRDKGYFSSKLHFRNDRYTVFKEHQNKDYILKGVDEFSKNQLCLPCGWWFELGEKL